MIKPRSGIHFTLHSGRLVHVDSVLLETELASLDPSRYSSADLPLLARRRLMDCERSPWFDGGPIHFHRIDEAVVEPAAGTRVLLSVLLWSEPIQPEFGFSELLVVFYRDWETRHCLEDTLQEELGNLDWDNLAVDRHEFTLHGDLTPVAPTIHNNSF
jgi:hypothetical protein